MMLDPLYTIPPPPWTLFRQNLGGLGSAVLALVLPIRLECCQGGGGEGGTRLGPLPFVSPRPSGTFISRSLAPSTGLRSGDVRGSLWRAMGQGLPFCLPSQTCFFICCFLFSFFYTYINIKLTGFGFSLPGSLDFWSIFWVRTILVV